jgi:hypothetical protein
MPNASQQLTLFINHTEPREPVIRVSPDASSATRKTHHPHLHRYGTAITAGNVFQDSSSVTQGQEPLSQNVDSGESEWSLFLREHGRVPLLEDEKKPWQYRGWLLYYRLLLDGYPGIGGRWDYWYRTMTAGRLLSEPIPKITFCDTGDKQVFKSIEQWVRIVDRYAGGWSAVDKLLDWFLWGFGHLKQEPQLSAELNENLYRQVNIGPLLLKPYDYLGAWIAMQKGNWNPNGFYPTPHSVVECMVRMTMEEHEDARTKTVMDPCVGSGRMLLHASNYSLRLYGVDIDPTLVKLTYVNGALYVPWILRPFPERFFVGK